MAEQSPSRSRQTSEEERAERVRTERRERFLKMRERQRLSRVFEMPDLSESGTVLSVREQAFFVEHGFLIKPRLLDDDRVDRALDRIWDHLIEHIPPATGSGA